MIRLLLLIVPSLIICLPAAAELAAPADLRVEGLANSLVVDRSDPAFSWKMQDARRGAAQTAYQILVASSMEKLAKDQGDLWDSGKVASDASIWVTYAGAKLVSSQKACWKVRQWDQAGAETPYSAPSWFQMGLLNPEKEWIAKWIQPKDEPLETEVTKLWEQMALIPQPGIKGVDEHNQKLMSHLRPSPLLRREFTLPAKPVRATLRSCNLGYGENWINGKKVGDGFFEPALTEYTKYALFNTYDVTSLLKEGKNALGIMLGDGWFYEPLAWSDPKTVYGRPVASAQLVVELENGEVVTIQTDGSWKTAPGPIQRNHYYIGEAYDARAFPTGWDQPDFNDSKWQPVVVVDAPTPELEAQKVEPERIVRRVKPVAVTNPAPGIYVFDMGEMLVGFPEIHVPAGQTKPVIVRCAEWAINATYNGRKYENLANHADALFYETIKMPLSIDGMIASKPRGGAFYGRGFTTPDGESIKKWNFAPPTMVYQGTGDAATWHPRFAVVPYRYVEVQGLKEKPTVDFLTGCVVHTDAPKTGEFYSSEKLYEDIHQAAMNSAQYCMHGMTWDNPCERAQQPMQHSEIYPTMAMSSNVRGITEKLIEDFRRVRKADGAAIYIPYTRRTLIYYSPRTWASPGPKQDSPDINLPYQYYQYYGDKRVLEGHLASIGKFFNHFYGPDNRYNKDPKFPYKWLRSNGTYDAHLAGAMRGPDDPAPEQDTYLYGGAYMHLIALRAAEIATICGDTAAAEKYRTIAANIRAEVQATWPTTVNKGYGGLATKKGGKPDLTRGNHIGNPLGVAFQVAPKEDWKAIVDNTAWLMKNVFKGHFVCGPQMVNYNLRNLSDYGYEDLAAEWMRSTEHPSYGYTLSFGTKTIWEGYTDPTKALVNSTVQNEFQVGANWLQESLCGVRADINGPGMKHFFLEPKIPTQIESAGTEFESPYGKIKSAWSQKDGVVTWHAVVPPNSTATAVFPDRAPLAKITEGGQPLAKAAGVSVVKAAGAAQVNLAAGSYRFQFELPKAN